MNSSIAVILGVLLYVVLVGVGLLITFWIIRTAVLSALAEDRRRVRDEERFLREHDLREQIAAKRSTAPRSKQTGGKHWLDSDGQ